MEPYSHQVQEFYVMLCRLSISLRLFAVLYEVNVGFVSGPVMSSRLD